MTKNIQKFIHDFLLSIKFHLKKQKCYRKLRKDQQPSSYGTLGLSRKVARFLIHNLSKNRAKKGNNTDGIRTRDSVQLVRRFNQLIHRA